MYYANGKHKLFSDFKAVYNQLKHDPQYQFIPFSEDHVLDFDNDLIIPEMHDRIIVGLAKRLNAPLITSDPVIVAAKLVEIIW